VARWPMCEGVIMRKGETGTLNSPFRRLAGFPVRIFPLALPVLAEGARRKVESFIVPCEHTDPGGGQWQLVRSSRLFVHGLTGETLPNGLRSL
jgi:hypothetical protein